MMALGWGIAAFFVLVIILVYARQRARSSDDSRRALAFNASIVPFSEAAFKAQSVAEICQLVNGGVAESLDAKALIEIIPFDQHFEMHRLDRGSKSAVPRILNAFIQWMRHNPNVILKHEMRKTRLGAMRGALKTLFAKTGTDCVIPLVRDGRILAVLGWKLGRYPSVADKQLLESIQLRLLASCSNVLSHKESNDLTALAQEIDLAASIELAMVPAELDGYGKDVEWTGHFQAAGRAGSDFWGVYPRVDGTTLVVMGDAVGQDLAGSLVSAVLKSCCESLFESDSAIGASDLLALLNRSLAQHEKPALSSCFAAVFNPEESIVHYSNAGHPVPYRLCADDEGLKVLTGSGPLLGHVANYKFKQESCSFASGDLFLFFTNGVTEAFKNDDTRSGYSAFQQVIQSIGAVRPEEMKAGLLEAMERQKNGRKQHDDEAFLVFHGR